MICKRRRFQWELFFSDRRGGHNNSAHIILYNMGIIIYYITAVFSGSPVRICMGFFLFPFAVFLLPGYNEGSTRVYTSRRRRLAHYIDIAIIRRRMIGFFISSARDVTNVRTPFETTRVTLRIIIGMTF